MGLKQGARVPLPLRRPGWRTEGDVPGALHPHLPPPQRKGAEDSPGDDETVLARSSFHVKDVLSSFSCKWRGSGGGTSASQ